ncbi:MAG: serine protease [Candidatus Hydrogenedentales bacterium]
MMTAIVLAGMWAAQADDKVIYGVDDRIDLYQERNVDRLEWAESVCALVSSSVLKDNGNGSFTLSTRPFTWKNMSPCPDEPFADQPTAAWCTGFIVNTDLIATAGHCIEYESDLYSTQFIFGFHMKDGDTAKLTFSEKEIYQGVEIVAHQYNKNYDFTIIRVDRPITVAQPLPLRTEGTVSVGTPVGIIGHPFGLPKKIAFGSNTKVRSNTKDGFFTANTDDYQGNSGSPVFNAVTGVVEGILVRGQTDFVIDADNRCFRSNVLRDDSEYNEEISKSTTFTAYVYDGETMDLGCGCAGCGCISRYTNLEDIGSILGDLLLIAITLLVLLGFSKSLPEA